MNGIWLLPTRSRLGKLTRCLSALKRCGVSTPGLILVQKDELKQRAAEYAALPLPGAWAILGTEADGMGDKIRELWPAYRALDWIGVFCDDTIARSYAFDRTLIESLTGRNFVSCDDGEQAPHRMAGVSLWSGGLARAVGWLWPEGFWHTYVDDVWEDLGRSTGCWNVRMDVLVTHEHPFKTGEKDETHERAYVRHADDGTRYAEWRLAERAAAVSAIRAIQSEKLTATEI